MSYTKEAETVLSPTTWTDLPTKQRYQWDNVLNTKKSAGVVKYLKELSSNGDDQIPRNYKYLFRKFYVLFSSVSQVLVID